MIIADLLKCQASTLYPKTRGAVFQLSRLYQNDFFHPLKIDSKKFSFSTASAVAPKNEATNMISREINL